eukprot:GGOE01049056.1.p2 GENE.GGOE01049056.1~~GGOE01049056.1.p2  ORF type:complete len:122 (-),score=7.40 GGOE01049056.1:274-639(-)
MWWRGTLPGAGTGSGTRPELALRGVASGVPTQELERRINWERNAEGEAVAGGFWECSGSRKPCNAELWDHALLGAARAPKTQQQERLPIAVPEVCVDSGAPQEGGMIPNWGTHRSLQGCAQ